MRWASPNWEEGNANKKAFLVTAITLSALAASADGRSVISRGRFRRFDCTTFSSLIGSPLPRPQLAGYIPLARDRPLATHR